MANTPLSPPEVEALVLTERGADLRLSVHVRPRASRSGVLGLREGALVLAVAAAPVDNAANEEIRELLAKTFGLRRADVDIVAGATGRSKIVELRGLSAREARDRLRAALR